jgi:HD-GYP domain-containing protein (c-di-GMP phosphodiesterase class II)
MLHNPDMAPPMPDFTRQVLPSDIDRVCEAFAMIVDAKSSFTAEHSRRVAHYAVQLAEALGWTPSA